jgi:hypothetical protein
MRSVVITSAISLIAGIVLELVVQTVPFAVPSVTPALLSALAAFSVFFAPTLLAVTFLANLLPGTARRLAECQH